MRRHKRIAAVTLALLAAQLAGCGGDDNNSPANNSPPPVDTGGGGSGTGGDGGGSGGDGGGNTPPAELASGTFVDAPVAGLSYTTSSNITNVTDADGRYEYRVGDTVTFSVGDLVLGTVSGQPLVTPMTVANALAASSGTSAATVAVNLLVLLQSLDANGNPEDGITLTAEIREAISANAIDVTASEAAFTTSLTTFVSNVNGATGLTLTPVSREDAVDHFVGQAPNALAGVYVRANENFEPITQKIVTLALFRSGRYLLGGQHDNVDCNLDSDRTPVNSQVFTDANGNGVEFGSYEWDPLTNAFSIANVTTETDGYCGFNEPVVDATNDTTELEVTSQGLVFRDSEGGVAYRFVRLAQNAAATAGAWVQPTALMNGHPFMFTLFPSADNSSSGRYLMVDASVPSSEFDTTPGIEEGCYSIDANNNLSVALDGSACESPIDTNNTAGVSSSESLQLFVDDYGRMIIAEGEDWTGFARVQTATLKLEDLTGAWILQTDRADGALGLQPQLFMLTVLEDGHFMFGGQENDATCVPGDYPAAVLEQDGNGVEYGELSLTAVRGLVVPQNVTVDSNGECGFFDANKAAVPQTQQRYFVIPQGDALTVWANDEEEDLSGLVFKRAPSEPNGITGAWLWSEDGASADQFAVSVYLPGGVMFETSTLPDDFGIIRESFTYEGTTMTSQNAGYEYCVDTQNAMSNCDSDPPSPIIETYIVEGDTVVDDEGNTVMTRIASPAP